MRMDSIYSVSGSITYTLTITGDSLMNIWLPDDGSESSSAGQEEKSKPNWGALVEIETFTGNGGKIAIALSGTSAYTPPAAQGITWISTTALSDTLDANPRGSSGSSGSWPDSLWINGTKYATVFLTASHCAVIDSTTPGTYDIRVDTACVVSALASRLSNIETDILAAQDTASNANTQLATHAGRTDNPHSVTAAQLGALTSESDPTATAKAQVVVRDTLDHVMSDTTGRNIAIQNIDASSGTAGQVLTNVGGSTTAWNTVASSPWSTNALTLYPSQPTGFDSTILKLSMSGGTSTLRHDGTTLTGTTYPIRTVWDTTRATRVESDTAVYYEVSRVVPWTGRIGPVSGGSGWRSGDRFGSITYQFVFNKGAGLWGNAGSSLRVISDSTNGVYLDGVRFDVSGIRATAVQQGPAIVLFGGSTTYGGALITASLVGGQIGMYKSGIFYTDNNWLLYLGGNNEIGYHGTITIYFIVQSGYAESTWYAKPIEW